MKVIVCEKFHTTMGTVIQVKDDRIFKVGDEIATDDGAYKIGEIIFPTSPDKDGFVNLLVTKED